MHNRLERKAVDVKVGPSSLPGSVRSFLAACVNHYSKKLAKRATRPDSSAAEPRSCKLKVLGVKIPKDASTVGERRVAGKVQGL